MTASVPEVRTRREGAAAAIRRSIILGQVEPGQKLREVALAAELGVSRPTLREALLLLTHEGLCEQEPHRGFSVATLDEQAVRDLAETRLTLDRLAAVTIAGDPAKCRELAQAWAAYEAAGHNPDPLAQHLAHVEFHRAMWAASHNDTLTRLWPTVDALSTLVLAQDQVMRGDPGRAVHLHGRIVDAVASGSSDAIEAALNAHTRQSAEEFIASRIQRPHS
jgi:DNA-binding GntR family transcriptional regulator